MGELCEELLNVAEIPVDEVYAVLPWCEVVRSLSEIILIRVDADQSAGGANVFEEGTSVTTEADGRIEDGSPPSGSEDRESLLSEDGNVESRKNGTSGGFQQHQYTVSSLPLSFLATLLIGATLGSAMAPSPLPLEEGARSWQPQRGDTFYVNTQDNLGYLLHPDGRRFVFRVATGQKRTVRYIGMTYFAGTPEAHWLVKSHHVQGDRITYGRNGHFLRMYKDGEEFSHYGIHTHATADTMLREQDRYASMGCIIVSTSILDLLERTYAVNEYQLPVITASGPPEYLLAMGK